MHRPGRNGGGVRGDPRFLATQGRVESHPCTSFSKSAKPRTLSTRSRVGSRIAPHQHRSGLRLRRRSRSTVLRNAIDPWIDAGRCDRIASSSTGRIGHPRALGTCSYTSCGRSTSDATSRLSERQTTAKLAERSPQEFKQLHHAIDALAESWCQGFICTERTDSASPNSGSDTRGDPGTDAG